VSAVDSDTSAEPVFSGKDAVIENTGEKQQTQGDIFRPGCLPQSSHDGEYMQPGLGGTWDTHNNSQDFSTPVENAGKKQRIYVLFVMFSSYVMHIILMFSMLCNAYNTYTVRTYTVRTI
jgi:hypothetical protein